MKPTNLHELWIDEMRDLYNAEQQIVEALPKMSSKATSQDLKSAFDEHLQVTKGQIQRLEQIFQTLGEKPSGKMCKGMQGIIQEGEDLIKQISDKDVLDAALIETAQKVEHYEIAGYGTVRTWAKLLKQKDAEHLLQQTLNEEGEADHKLSRIAESHINMEAAHMQKAA